MITHSIAKPRHEAWSGFSGKMIVLILILAGVSSPSFAQVPQSTFMIKGTVTTSEDGAVLPGANIYLKNTQIGTTSDGDGNFEFPKKLTAGDILVFSYIGYVTQEITVNDQTTNLNVVMVFDAVAAYGALSESEPLAVESPRSIRKLFRKAKSGI